MHTKRRSFPVAVKCGLLLLAFAVFGFGLQAKMSLSKANGSSPNGTVKLSTEERSGQSLFSEVNKVTRRAHASESLRLPVALLFERCTCHSSHYCEVELSLCTPRRYDSLGPDRLNLPPPTLS